MFWTPVGRFGARIGRRVERSGPSTSHFPITALSDFGDNGLYLRVCNIGQSEALRLFTIRARIGEAVTQHGFIRLGRGYGLLVMWVDSMKKNLLRRWSSISAVPQI
jgi:hypothetical protein